MCVLYCVFMCASERQNLCSPGFTMHADKYEMRCIEICRLCPIWFQVRDWCWWIAKDVNLREPLDVVLSHFFLRIPERNHANKSRRDAHLSNASSFQCKSTCFYDFLGVKLNNSGCWLAWCWSTPCENTSVSRRNVACGRHDTWPMQADMQEQLQLALSKVIPKDVSLFFLLVCWPLASVYFHIA